MSTVIQANPLPGIDIPFSCETWELMRECVEVANAKRLAAALGIQQESVNRMARPQLSIARPDATGARNHWDRTAAIAAAIAGRGEKGRVLLRKLRLWHDVVFDTALDEMPVRPLGADHVMRKVGAVTAAFASFLSTVDPERLDAEQLRRITDEGLKVIDLIDRVVRAAQLACH